MVSEKCRTNFCHIQDTVRTQSVDSGGNRTGIGESSRKLWIIFLNFPLNGRKTAKWVCDRISFMIFVPILQLL